MTASRAVHSNAFNFTEHLQHAVDTRTGQYTVSVDLPELKSNRLCGPAVPLQVQFDPLNVADSGFGRGWSLNFSQYAPDTRMLALNTGESFKVTGSGTQPIIKEKKLDSFHFFDEGNDTYRVVHKSGLVEILRTGGTGVNRFALPVQIQAPSGHSISLSYLPFRGGQMLESVSDAYGTLLRIERDTNSSFVKVHLHPDSGPGGLPLATYELKLDGEERVSEVVLPTDEKASWRFQYRQVFGLDCLSEVQTPVGCRETIEYLDGGHAYPGPARDPLPRVTRHCTYPGSGQPMMEVTYTWTDHNFIGNGAPIGWADDGLDNLYKAGPDYQYGSVASLMEAGQPVRTVSRTFNRFHLQTEELTTQGDCVQRVVTHYHDLDVPFDQQPPQFQLPKSATTSWTLKSDPSLLRSTVERTAFDEHGNPTEKITVDGIRETYSWYSKDGEDGCPADPHGFVRFRKEQTTYPADTEQGQAPVLKYRYRYQALPALAAAGTEDWLVVTTETLTSSEDGHAAALRTVDTRYHDLPDDPSLHGRPASSKETMGQYSRTTDHAYTTTFSRLAGETVGQVVDTLTGFDGCTKTLTRQESLHSGDTRLADDANGVQVKSDYDALGRLVRQTVAPGTEHEAVCSYTYRLASQLGQQASQEMTNVTGVSTRTVFDGIRRVVLEEKTDKANSGAWRKTFEALHDSRGWLVQSTDYDWLGEQDLPLTQHFDYDDWGQQCKVTGPDGVSTLTELSPFGVRGPVQRVWRENAREPGLKSAVSITQMNAFDKPDSIVRKDENGQTVGSLLYVYDGKGNCIEQTRQSSELTRVTRYEYDVWQRMTHTRLPDLTAVSREFAEHSVEELPTRLTVTPGDQSRPAVMLGAQTFDSLDRLAELTVGPRVERYHYQGDSLQISQRITPGNKVFDYAYSLDLTDQPRSITPAGDASRMVEYTYDSQTALLTGTGKNAQEQDVQYAYDDFGHLRRETRVEAGRQLQSDYQTSLFGRALSHVTTAGLETRYTYDAHGRQETITQGKLSTRLEYDHWGRLSLSTVQHSDSNASLTTALEYDSMDRELKRTLSVTGQPQRVLLQTWYDDDQLHTRDLTVAGQSVCKETFVYDLRDRLEQYSCVGTQVPADAQGNRLADQVFQFDALDNITRCLSQYQDGSRDLARYTYAADDSCQLRQVTHNHASYPASIDFSYDDDGHQLNDELGNRLSYNDEGRLLEVRKAANDELMMACRYDGHNDLLAVRSGTASETLRFYKDYRLSHTIQASTLTQCLYRGDTPVGQQQVDDDSRTLLLLTDSAASVIGEYQVSTQVRDTNYGPYGEQEDDPLLSLLGFNGEPREAPGWYLLGRGYRAYNPNLMRFHSPDSLSPFGSGGINPYMYCNGNPVSFRDPTGHRSSERDRPGGDPPDYQDPIEQSNSGGTDWMYWVGLVASVVMTGVAFKAGLKGASWSDGLKKLTGRLLAPLVGTAGVVASVIGVATHNELAGYIGFGLGLGAGAVGGVQYAWRRYGRAGLQRLRNYWSGGPPGSARNSVAGSSSAGGSIARNSPRQSIANEPPPNARGGMLDPDGIRHAGFQRLHYSTSEDSLYNLPSPGAYGPLRGRANSIGATAGEYPGTRARFLVPDGYIDTNGLIRDFPPRPGVAGS